MLSRRVVPTVLLIAVVAIASGVVMAAAAGARRSSSSLDRLLAWSHPPDASVGGISVDSSDEADRVLTATADLPTVEASVRSIVIGDGVRLADGRTYVLTVRTVAGDLTDPAFGRMKLLHGRLPDPSARDEAFVGFVTADLLKLHVGDRVDVLFGLPGEDGSTTDPVTVVGIGAYPSDFPSLTGRADKSVMLTPAFEQAHADRIDWTNGGVLVHLRGADAAAVEQFRGDVTTAGLPIGGVGSVHEQAVGARRVVTVEARGLWLIAIVIAAATVLILFQLMRRDASLLGDQLVELANLGMTRRGLLASGALRGARVGVIGAASGVAIAVLASPAFPVGISRNADPDIGFHADLAVLAIGAVAAIAVAVLTSMAGVQSVARRPAAEPSRRTRLPSLVALIGPVGFTGARLAFGSPGHGNLGRSRLGQAVSVVTLALLISAVSLQSSFDHLLGAPALVGATWDVALAYDNPDDRSPALDKLASEPSVSAFSPGGWFGAQVNDRPVYVMALDPTSGIDVAVDRGRAPRGPAEIALGATDLAAIGASVGDQVTIALGSDSSTPPKPVTVTVVGRAIMASPVYFALPLGEGAAIPLSLFDQLGGDRADLANVFVKLRPGVPLDAGYTEVVDHLQPNFSFPRPENIGINSLDRLKTAIRVLVGVLSVLCTTSFVHSLVVQTRRNRHDIATLRSLGFTSRQATLSHLLHGALTAAVTVVVAIPLAVVAASLTWRRIAEYMGRSRIPSPRSR